MQKLASDDAATAATPNFSPTARDKGALIEWLGSPKALPQYTGPACPDRTLLFESAAD